MNQWQIIEKIFELLKRRKAQMLYLYNVLLVLRKNISLKSCLMENF